MYNKLNIQANGKYLIHRYLNSTHILCTMYIIGTTFPLIIFNVLINRELSACTLLIDSFANNSSVINFIIKNIFVNIYYISSIILNSQYFIMKNDQNHFFFNY